MSPKTWFRDIIGRQATTYVAKNVILRQKSPRQKSPLTGVRLDQNLERANFALGTLGPLGTLGQLPQFAAFTGISAIFSLHALRASVVNPPGASPFRGGKSPGILSGPAQSAGPGYLLTPGP